MVKLKEWHSPMLLAFPSASSISGLADMITGIENKQTTSFKSIKNVTLQSQDTPAHLVSTTAVLWGQDESRQVTGQIKPFEVPHQVPEDDGVLVHNARGRHGLVPLVHQQALQLLPQDQWAQVGYRHRSRGGSGGWCGAHTAPLVVRGCYRHCGLGTEWHRCVLVCNRITFLSRAEGEDTEWIWLKTPQG